MRQPTEDKVVTICRARGSLTFPANFMLVAAMNPCPCGYYRDPIKPCSCAPSTVTKYQKRIFGPLLDRIDIHVEVPRVDYQQLSDDRLGEASELIRHRVEKAREWQRKGLAENQPSNAKHPSSKMDVLSMVCNADMCVAEIRQIASSFAVDGAGKSLVGQRWPR